MFGKNQYFEESKKPSKAFMLFCDGLLKDYKEDFPRLSFKHLIQLISEEWKHLPSNEKQFYRKRSTEFQFILPKRFSSPYNFFLVANKKSFGEGNSLTANINISMMWDKLASSKKLEYIVKSNEDKMRYIRDIDDFIELYECMQYRKDRKTRNLLNFSKIAKLKENSKKIKLALGWVDGQSYYNQGELAPDHPHYIGVIEENSKKVLEKLYQESVRAFHNDKIKVQMQDEKIKKFDIDYQLASDDYIDKCKLEKKETYYKNNPKILLDAKKNYEIFKQEKINKLKNGAVNANPAINLDDLMMFDLEDYIEYMKSTAKLMKMQIPSTATKDQFINMRYKFYNDLNTRLKD